MFSDGEVAVRALEAGVDQLLDPPDLTIAFEAVLEAVADGLLTEQRIEEWARRVLELKAERGFATQGAVTVDRARVDAVVGAPAPAR